MKKCSFKGIEIYIELIILGEKGREKSQYFLKCRDLNVLYGDVQRLPQFYLTANYVLKPLFSGTVIIVNLQLTIALTPPVT